MRWFVCRSSSLRPKASSLLAAFAVLALSASSAFATVIVLKNGKRIEGEIVERNTEQISIKVKGGKVEVYKVKEIDHLEEPPPPPVVSNDTGDAKVDARTKDYERRTNLKLAAVLTELVVVRGDHPQAELKQVADASEKAIRHFMDLFGCKPEECLHGERYGPARLEVQQFVREEGYLAFCDKVLREIRDRSVDDARLALMRRQRGFWVMTPRSMLAQYQGPSDLTTCVSAAVHKTSHVLLEGWKPSGDFRPWWLYEGLGCFQEFAVLQESRTYCVDLEKTAAYGSAGSPAADEEAKAKTESGWKQTVKRLLQKHDEKELGTLAKMALNELILIDVQQSWSLVDWLFATGKLKEFVGVYKDERELPETCRRVFQAVPAEVHERWRQWVLRTY
jgi:hypothetical protein